MASKGKAVMASGKDGPPKKNRGMKRKNRDVLQFFEDAADEFDDNDDSDGSDAFFDYDDLLEDYNEDPKEKSVPGKSDHVPFFPKEEELSGDELEKVLEERYRSGFVRYAEDDYESKHVDRSFTVPSGGEPIIWKVKSKVGREKNVVFCLIQKYLDLKDLGIKLQIISAFAVDHVKGYVFVEAAKQSDVTEACKQLADVYFTLVTRVPTNELGQLLNVKRKHHEIKVGTWARMKNGIYRGDLTQVVAVNNERKRATVKLIPRIDLQVLTEKYGGGAILKRTKTAVPQARLISSRDLDEFRPLIQYRRDRDVGQIFEFLDGLMLKDGFLFKKVSVDSLAFWDVNPSEDELQKFSLPGHDDSDNLEWLSQLYGEQKKCKTNFSKGDGKGEGGKGGKGDGSSGSNEQSSFEVHDLVLFGKREFGMVIGMEKDESYRILKQGSDGPVTLTLGQKELKYLPLDKKFTALDHRTKTISINDTVKILDGPIKGKQGLVKQIYRGIVFLFDESDLDNAYFCCKSQMSERVKHSDPESHGKDEGCASAFEDVPSSPKSPLSPKKPWQMRDNSDDQRDKGDMLSVGQPLRIRVGPLKGYLCRVVAVRYSDVTVKLDSRQKVLTVKREHLSEVRGKTSAQAASNDPELGSSFTPFELLGAEGGQSDWLQGATGSVADGGWNVCPSNDRSSLPASSSWGSSSQVRATANPLPGPVDNDSGQGDVAWASKVNSSQKSSWDGNEDGAGAQGGAWGTSTTSTGWGKNSGSGNGDGAGAGAQGGAWGTSTTSTGWGKNSGSGNGDGAGAQGGAWGTSTTSTGWGKNSGSGPSSSWEKAKVSEGSSGGCADNLAVNTWGQGSKASEGTSGWSNQVTGQGNPGSWSNGKKSGEDAGAWSLGSSGNDGPSGWGKQKPSDESTTMGDGAGKPSSDAWGKGSVTDVNNQWGKSKDSGTETSTEDPWSKVVNEWGSKDSSNKSKGWGNSSVSSGGDEKAQDQGSGGWTKSQENNTVAGWGMDSGPDKTSSWKTKSFGDNSNGNNSWQQTNRSHDDQGFSGGRGSGGRRGRGHDQFGRGRGRGRFSDDGSYSSFNKDGQDNHSSGSKGWNKNEGGTSWGNPSTSDGLSSWGNGKSWNSEGDGRVMNQSSELEKNTSGTGWNGASSDSSGWGQKSWGTGNDLAAEAAENRCGKSQEWTSTKSGQSSEGFATDAWSKGGTADTSAWKKDGDGWQGKSWDKGSGSSAGGSWSKGGNSGWERSGNSENDQGFGSGRGSGRRGRGGFGRGRDQTGRDGGRSGGRGHFSSWKDERQGGSSWGNASAQNGGNNWSSGGEGVDKGQTKAGGDDSSWGGGGGTTNFKNSWGSAGSWSNKGQDNANAEMPGKKNWANTENGGNSISGGSSWGKSQLDKSGDKSWGNTYSGVNSAVGDSSWGNPPSNKAENISSGNTEGGNSVGDGSSWGNSQSNRAENKSWGNTKSGGNSVEGGSSWGKSQPSKAENKSAGDTESGGNSVGGGSSWGKSVTDKAENKPGESSSVWGGNINAQTGSVNNDKTVKDGTDNVSSGNKSWNSGQGGSSWGTSQSGGSWGNAQGSGNSSKSGGWGS